LNGIIDDVVDSEMEDLISDLQTLIRYPSVSAKRQGLVDCAKSVAGIMDKAGIKSQVLYSDSVSSGNNSDYLPAPPPIVYGEVKSKSNPNGKTILFYNHYDVQPEDPVELWDIDPFSGKIEGDRIFGRGSADDKGELITRIKAVEYYLKKTGDVPCNVKYMVEGEEEIGSVHIEQYLTKYREKLNCDGVIWEFGYIDVGSRPIISLGMKGLLYVELIAKGPARDAHSSLAVLIENPAWRLIKALNTLRDDKGKILIRDWYKDVRQFTPEELCTLSRDSFDENEFKKEYQIRTFVNNVAGIDAIKALVGMATCNIAGLASGYTGEGAKTVLPAIATAKLDFRLIPNMIPEKQFSRLKDHLKENGFDNDIEARIIHGEAAVRTSINDPFVKQVEESANEIFGSSIISISSAGTGPMYPFVKILNVPCISVGSTYVFSRIHSPNEFARIDLLNKTTKCIGRIMEKFARSS
jgi:acetylornithine deacetylase/succinyl-diaminopimelate desuccinylase-like protein